MPTGQTPGGKVSFPDFDVLGQVPTWDDVTKGVVLARVGPQPPVRFFTVAEEAIARPMLDRMLAQDDEPKVPVFEVIDARLAERETDGYRYETMPEDGEAWRQSLAALDLDARAAHDRTFPELDPPAQRLLMDRVRTGETAGDHPDWHGLPAKQVWSLWLRYAITAFYAHPWAWNEIGFGGPAYPRGYKNIGVGKLEPWEKHETDARDPVRWAERVERARSAHGA